MRRGSRRAAINSAKSKGPVVEQSKPSKLMRQTVARIRERRERIYQREGILPDSAILIREGRDR